MKKTIWEDPLAAVLSHRASSPWYAESTENEEGSRVKLCPERPEKMPGLAVGLRRPKGQVA